MRESNVSLDVGVVITMIEERKKEVLKIEQRNLNKFIERNTRPAKKGWFKWRPEQTREQAEAALDEPMIDDIFGVVTFREEITQCTRGKIKTLENLENMCHMSSNGLISLSQSDFELVTKEIRQ